MRFKTVAIAALATIAVSATAAQARDQIRIVGSSTVFPFSTTVAEQFGKTTSFKTPIVESTGSGGGMKLFCSGVGTAHPDITNASRRMKSSEFDKCHEAGVTDITEVKIGFDGIVMANAKDAPSFALTKRIIFLALAKDVPDPNGGENLVPNPYTKWSEIDPSLPNVEIEVLGPPPTSGTRDAFQEIALEGGAKTFDWIKAMKKADKAAYKKVARTVREDGPYIEAGENDNLIVQKLAENGDRLGIFGFSFLEENRDKVKGNPVDGVNPTFEAIAAGDYGVSRSLFFYVKNAHRGVIPGIEEFVAEFTKESTWGPDGYLVDKGLIPLPDAERAEGAQSANAFVNLPGV